MIAETAPDFVASGLMPRSKTFEDIQLSHFRGKYVVLFFYPLGFTFVCPTEITSFSDRQVEFEALNCTVIAASCDSVYTHLAWSNTSRENGGIGEMKIPIISDFDKSISTKYNVLMEDGSTLRATFIISPTGILRHCSINDTMVGRSVDEVLRLVEAFQFTDTHGEVCPANWKPGMPTINTTTASDYFRSVNHATHTTNNISSANVRNEVTRVKFTTKFINGADPTYTWLEHLYRYTVAPIQSGSVALHQQCQALLHDYNHAVKASPMLTKAITSCVIGLLGELIGSYVKYQRSVRAIAENRSVTRYKTWFDAISVRRLAVFGVYGFAITGPFFHWWYQFLEHITSANISLFTDSSSTSISKLSQPSLFVLKLAINQLLMTPPFLLFTLAYINYLLTFSTNKTVQQIKSTFVVALLTNWKFVFFGTK